MLRNYIFGVSSTFFFLFPFFPFFRAGYTRLVPSEGDCTSLGPMEREEIPFKTIHKRLSSPQLPLPVVSSAVDSPAETSDASVPMHRYALRAITITLCTADHYYMTTVDKFQSEIRIPNVCKSNSNFENEVWKFELCLTSLLEILDNMLYKFTYYDLIRHLVNFSHMFKQRQNTRRAINVDRNNCETHHRTVDIKTPMPIQSTKTTHSRNLMKSTKWSFNTTANPTDDTTRMNTLQPKYSMMNKTLHFEW